jgi:hypothetical protein
MKANKLLIVLVVLLMGVSALCLRYGLALQEYRGRMLQFPSFELPDVRVQYPIEGLSVQDLQEIMMIYSEMPEHERPGGILEIIVHGNDHVVLNSGSLHGPLEGGGLYLIFIRTEEGWKLGDNRRFSGWAA